ncbi:hypothetical protein [Streptomyces sp. NPDC050504]|uniref:hypothetical protein n=1 Tax=Streptomyces sp. NPDC050504 TaxID=3365618 RepID=UPI0037909EA4
MFTTRTGLGAFLTAAALTLTAAPLAAATADGRDQVAPARTTTAPAFLTAAQMPPSATPWTAGAVTRGLPETVPYCVKSALPAQGTSHRTFRTELDTGGAQITTVAATDAAASNLVTELRRLLANCATRVQQEYPDVIAKGAYHGKLTVEEGAYVYSLDTADPEVGNTDIALYSVGRDGRTVTFVEWGQMGDLADAPLTAFKTTTRTAVNKLYG